MNRGFAPKAAKATEETAAGERTPSVSRHDPGAQIALIVLLSFLQAYTIPIFVMGCIETDRTYFEHYDAMLNPAHIISLVVYGVSFLWLIAYFVLRVKSPRSLAVAVRSDVLVFSTFAVLILVLSIVTLAITSMDSPEYTGTLTAVFGLAWGAFLLIIVLFQAIYTRVHHKDRGAWRRRFATAVSEPATHALQPVVQQSRSGRSSNASKVEREDAPGLPY